jgi:glycosyltransferase involved in cell wall biosynthesis
MRKPLPRILHLIDTAGPGGAETILTHLASGLQAQGWVSRVLVPREDWLSRRLFDLSVDTRVIEHRGSASWRLLTSLVREIYNFKPDILHAHFLGSGVYGSLASNLSTRIPLVCTFHGTPDVNPRDASLRLKSRILTRPRNRVVYVSHHLRRHLEPILGVPPHLGVVIHNGVPFSDEEPEAARTMLSGLDPQARLIGAVGNIRPAKDYPNLLQAARRVRDVRPQVQFAILGGGQGELFEGILRMKRELGLDDTVHFMGFQANAQSIMRSFEIFVSSSETEGLPLASVEAMGMGLPVVLTNCGGVPEVVEDGRSGLLVPTKNPDALAEGLLALLEDPAFAARLGNEARLRARSNFSLDSMLQGYTGLYQELLNA